MNLQPKVLLTINLEGGTLIKGKPEVRKYYITKKDMFPKQNFKGNTGKQIIKSGKYTYVPLTTNVAKQKMTINQEAYDNMTSPLCPQWFKNQKEWRKMDKTHRLELNLSRICQSLSGKSFTYQIIED